MREASSHDGDSVTHQPEDRWPRRHAVLGAAERAPGRPTPASRTPAQLVTYLSHLDDDAHPGWLGPDFPNQEAVSGRVYDALAPTIDKNTTARSATDPAPEVLIDDTLATKAP
ncbi:hypothetical protein [Streptomyces niveus]|uniref:hypothetical protein n=1 Tax=Streptomyces niveus TaxID=193462 RepID=UPI0036D36A4B